MEQIIRVRNLYRCIWIIVMTIEIGIILCVCQMITSSIQREQKMQFSYILQEHLGHFIIRNHIMWLSLNEIAVWFQHGREILLVEINICSQSNCIAYIHFTCLITYIFTSFVCVRALSCVSVNLWIFNGCMQASFPFLIMTGM
jgi:hypothetical protein